MQNYYKSTCINEVVIIVSGLIVRITNRKYSKNIDFYMYVYGKIIIYEK